MTHNDTFSLRRFQLYFQRYLFLNYKGVLIAFAAISGLLIFISVLTSIGNRGISQDAYIVLSYVSFFLGGAVITSMSFNEMHRPEKSIHYFTLPASQEEKFFAAYLSTTVLYVLVAVSFYYLAYYVASGLALMLTKTPLEPINYFDASLWKIIGIYLIMHSVFFLGAVYFKGYNFLKTLLALFVINFTSTMLQSLFSIIVFGDVIFSDIEDVNFSGEEYFTDTLLPTLKIIGFYILPTFFLVVSYIRYNEREA